MIAFLMIMCLIGLVASLILVQFQAPTQYRAHGTMALRAILSDRKPNCGVSGESQTKENVRINKTISVLDIIKASQIEILPPIPKTTIELDLHDCEIMDDEDDEIEIVPDSITITRQALEPEPETKPTFDAITHSVTYGEVCYDPGFRIHPNIHYYPHFKF